MAVRAAILEELGPLPFDKGLNRCLKPSTESDFWEPAADTTPGQSYSGFLRAQSHPDGVPGSVHIVCLACTPHQRDLINSACGLVRPLLANCSIRVVEPDSLGARDALTRSCSEAGAARFRLHPSVCPMEGACLDAAALHDAIGRAIPLVGASGAMGGSTSLTGTVGVLAITFKPMAALDAGSDASSRGSAGKLRLVGSYGLPQCVNLARDPLAADGFTRTTHRGERPVALVSLPACPSASTDILAAAGCIARATASILGMLPCRAARCLFEAAGGSKAPLPDRPLRECPVCTRKLCTVSSGCPGGMGASAARIVGRLRVLRACLLEVLQHLAPDGYRPPATPRPMEMTKSKPAAAAASSAASAQPAIASWDVLKPESATHAMQERVWLREKALELTALGLASPCASDEVDTWDMLAERLKIVSRRAAIRGEPAIRTAAVRGEPAIRTAAVRGEPAKDSSAASWQAQSVSKRGFQARTSMAAVSDRPGRNRGTHVAPRSIPSRATDRSASHSAADVSEEYLATAAMHASRDHLAAAAARKKQMGWGAAAPWDR